MLTKRAQILFDEDLWKRLSRMAKESRTSASEIIRDAVQQKLDWNEELKNRQEAIKSILKHRPKPFNGKIDYKALINEGRKVY